MSGRFLLKCVARCSFGHAVAQLVEALCYKPKGAGFDSRWCHLNFSLISHPAALWPGVGSACNRNKYQVYFLGDRGCKGGRCVGVTNRLHLQIVLKSGSFNPWNPQGLSKPVFGIAIPLRGSLDSQTQHAKQWINCILPLHFIVLVCPKYKKKYPSRFIRLEVCVL